jgi:hypothetical protein
VDVLLDAGEVNGNLDYEQIEAVLAEGEYLRPSGRLLERIKRLSMNVVQQYN